MNEIAAIGAQRGDMGTAAIPFNSGDRYIIIWTRPQLGLETTQALISQAIAPPALP